jgi:outer membrane protein assembly factor BamE (lipoprotein component of BamABCDE complex)
MQGSASRAAGPQGDGQAGRGRMTVRAAEGRGPRRGLSMLACLFAVLSLVLAACAPVISDHGYVPTDDELALLQVGTDTRESVAATVGRPSASGLLNDEGWYYVESRWQTRGGRAPQEIDRQVVAISFTPDGIVENIERFGLDRGRIVPLSRRVTTTNIKGKSALSQIFGNIGRVNTESLFN